MYCMIPIFTSYPPHRTTVLFTVAELPYPVAGYWAEDKQRFYLHNIDGQDDMTITHWQIIAEKPQEEEGAYVNPRITKRRINHNVQNNPQDPEKGSDAPTRSEADPAAPDIRRDFLPAEQSPIWPHIKKRGTAYDKSGSQVPSPADAGAGVPIPKHQNPVSA